MRFTMIGTNDPARIPLNARFAARAADAICILAVLGVLGSSRAWAFDRDGYKMRADQTLAELNTKKLPDSKATLARLDEMMAIGIAAIREFGARNAKYSGLANAAIADAQPMKGLTDAELEDKWGETGYGGDTVGIPLKSLGESSAARAYLELIVSPAMQYVYVNKWQSAKKVRWLDKARDEAVELSKRLDSFPEE
jgi:hypothetical protein